MKRQLWSLEGNTQKLDGGAMFGNAPRALWERWATPDERHRIDLACRCMLIREPGKQVLLETGVGAFFSPKMADRYGVQESSHVLLRSLMDAGTFHRDIDVVILSHLHFDHAGGLLSSWREDEEPELLFPKARFLVSRAAWERANNPHPRDRASFIPRIQELLLASGRLEIVDAETSPTLGPDYRFRTSDGHTPGMLITELATSEGPLVFGADLVPGRAWVHASITMGYDRFPERLIDEKRALLQDLAQRRGRLFFTHDPEVAMAYVNLDERGRFGSYRPSYKLEGVEV